LHGKNSIKKQGKNKAKKQAAQAGAGAAFEDVFRVESAKTVNAFTVA
jgi:hypothetical protein